MLRSTCLAGLFVILISPVAHGQRAAAIPEIDSSIRNVIAAASHADAKAVLADAAGDFSLVDGLNRYSTREAALDAMTKNYAPYKAVTIVVSHSETRMLSPQVALYYADGAFNATDAAGTVGPTSGFTWSIVWRREGKNWKMVSVHQSIGPAQK